MGHIGKTSLVGKVSLASVIATVMAAAPGASTAEENTMVLEEISVTASRVTRDGFSAPTPTTIVDAGEITKMSPSTTADFINQLPALSGSFTPRTTQNGVGGGFGGANFLNLRNLGQSRTLTLLNGQRVVPSATTGAVDINLLPTALLSRVDIVTGGASAAWGSDAVAGVINLVVDTDFEGVKGRFHKGYTDQGGGEQTNFDLSFGTGFNNDRGHLIISGSYADIEAVNRADSRDWYTGSKIINNPAYAPGNGEPMRIIAPDVGVGIATEGGLVIGGPLHGTRFGEGGAPEPFDFGIFTGLLKAGGTPSDLAAESQLLSPLERKSIYARVDYDLSDTVSAFAEVNYGNTVSDYLSVPYFRFANIAVTADNPYLHPNMLAMMNDAGVNSVVIGRTNYDQGEARPRNERELMSFSGGLEGEIDGGWRWNAYYTHGTTDILNLVENDAIVSRYNLAIDAVRDPGSGDIVCRSSLTEPGNGCLPLNIIGPGGYSQQAHDWVYGTAVQNIKITQQVAAATIQGEPFSLWAGPVSIATGLEYRKEKYDADADAISIANDFWVGNYKPSGGSYDVKEGFLETVVPLAQGEDFARAVDLNAAVRYADYSTSGGATTWKVGLSYQVNDDVRFRLTRSRDVRAPNLNDLYLGGQVNSQSVTDPLNSNESYFVLRILSGNTDLKPEKADTFTAGVVVTPGFLPGFSASVDYFDISIKDAITTLDLQQIVDGCTGGSAELCGFIRRDGTGYISQVTATGLNFQSESEKGFDFDFSYRTEIDGLGSGFDGGLSLRALGTYIYERTITGLNTTTEYAGGLSYLALPKWKWLISATYETEKTTASLRGRYIGGAKLRNEWQSGVDIDDNTVSPVMYFDLALSRRLGGDFEGMELKFAVENLFDKAPPLSPSTGVNTVTDYGVNHYLYDTIGRQFHLELSFDF